ncbi:hypothetical protein [Croceibacterium aestuarii]|uniref:hypothetical protein n=1 Tax=Croceibacterium aestuarii TaxID=3064139 RepID=UPI00272EDD0D|nr:hypothetical protein [Croceibacterium sp. D39]
MVARALSKHTQCEVLLAPGLARKVVDAAPDSADEEKLREQLAKETEACGEIEVDSKLAGLIHRSYLAETLYHWTRSNGDSDKS